MPERLAQLAVPEPDGLACRPGPFAPVQGMPGPPAGSEAEFRAWAERPGPSGAEVMPQSRQTLPDAWSLAEVGSR